VHDGIVLWLRVGLTASPGVIACAVAPQLWKKVPFRLRDCVVRSCAAAFASLLLGNAACSTPFLTASASPGPGQVSRAELAAVHTWA